MTREPCAEEGLISKQLALLLEREGGNATLGASREGWDLPVVVFWGLALMSMILSTLLAFELWAAY